MQYDSNVPLDPSGGGVLPTSVDQRREDAAFIFGAGGAYDVVRRPDTLLRLEYDLYQTLHTQIRDFDFRSHRTRVTVSHALRSWCWAGVQGGYDHYTLGDHSYLSEPSVTPFVSLLEGSRALTQVSYRRGWATYLSSPFHDLRDGPNDTVGTSQTFTSADRSLTFGFQYGDENPEPGLTGGRLLSSDFRFRSYQWFAGVGFTPGWATTVDLMYLFRYDDYSEPNSQSPTGKARTDEAHEISAALRRPIAEHLDAALVYYGTFNNSNVAIYEYRRQVVSALLEVTF